MILTEDLRKEFSCAAFSEKMKLLYACGGAEAEQYAARYAKLLESFEQYYGKAEQVSVFSAPGRTEIGGNHTDHQHGCVLAASVNLDVIGIAAPDGSGSIRIKSEGFPEDVIDLGDLSPKPEEKNRASALIRGVAARFQELGYPLKGFHAYTTSTVFKGSGLSSSAAFEVIVGGMINSLFCGGKVSPVEIAKMGQYAENVYFGKASGLMDQTASSVGGIVSIDFESTENPLIRKIDYDFTRSGHKLCIIDTGADHADLSDEYTAIPLEMKEVAAFFGKEYLRQVPEEDFLAHLAELRKTAGDRAVLRALHFYADNRRAVQEARCLERGDFASFLREVTLSGQSSSLSLQNVSPTGAVREQPVAVALALCGKLLGGNSAYRVHGGGFAGTVQAFVPDGEAERFQAAMEGYLGKGCCHLLTIRPIGGVCLF